ncbi:Hypothetical predicted protein [Xyrichtys novacula]|uniref:Uncharacterized protein n=1 Tax=Xyrichtys novacula TaxID=13765 RepID=A0AAV1H3B5_XYRNO|nr:Hypothetical predicted protein [Xyrichtys novacula]
MSWYLTRQLYMYFPRTPLCLDPQSDFLQKPPYMNVTAAVSTFLSRPERRRQRQTEMDEMMLSLSDDTDSSPLMEREEEELLQERSD